jgi:hypothetical protein
MESDHVYARLEHALETLLAQAMEYEATTPSEIDYVRTKDAAARLFHGGLVPGTEETLAGFPAADRDRIAEFSASAFATGVLVGLTATREGPG